MMHAYIQPNLPSYVNSITDAEAVVNFARLMQISMRDEVKRAELATELARAKMKEMDALAAVLLNVVSSSGFDLGDYTGPDYPLPIIRDTLSSVES